MTDEYPTELKLERIMEEKTGFYESQSSVLRTLRNNGFRYRKCNTGKNTYCGKISAIS